MRTLSEPRGLIHTLDRHKQSPFPPTQPVVIDEPELEERFFSKGKSAK